jgi:hypothetical protein
MLTLLTRQWIYYISAFVVAFVSVLTCFIKESRPKPIPTTPARSAETKTPETESSKFSFGRFAHETFCFPVELFFTEPIIAIVTIMAASVFALLYLFTEAWPVVYKAFGCSEKQIALIPLALNPGLVFPFLVRIWDMKVANKMKHKGVAMVS